MTEIVIPSLRAPDLRATVRLQFHRGFSFDAAVPLVPYFAQLGISHIYSPPILKARPGSTRGYDMIDPTCVNPELGGEEGLLRLVAALRAEQMGDLVRTTFDITVAGAHAALDHGCRVRRLLRHARQQVREPHVAPPA